MTFTAVSSALTLEAQQRSGKKTGVSRSEEEGNLLWSQGRICLRHAELLGTWPVAEDDRMASQLWNLEQMGGGECRKVKDWMSERKV